MFFGCLGGADEWQDRALCLGLTGYLTNAFIQSTCGDSELRLRLHAQMLLLESHASLGAGWSKGERRDLNPLVYTKQQSHDPVQTRPLTSDALVDRTRATLLLHAVEQHYGRHLLQQVVVDGYVKSFWILSDATCWWYSLCTFQYRPHDEQTGSGSL